MKTMKRSLLIALGWLMAQGLAVAAEFESAGKKSGFEGGSAQEISVAFFYKHRNEGQWPQEVEGDEIRLLQQMKPIARTVMLANVMGVKAGDVFSLHADLLRSDVRQATGFGDRGIDCDLSVRVQSDREGSKEKNMTITGACNVFMVDPKTNEQLKTTLVIPPKLLPDTDFGGKERWVLIVHDEKGLALYAKAKNY